MFVIRAGEPRDLAALLAIETACFSTERISARQMRYFLTRAKARLLVTEDPGQGSVYGYALVLLPALPRPARLYSLAVAPAWRGQGLADQLLARVVELARDARYDRLRLEVRAQADELIAWYGWRGFKLLRRLPGYYQEGADALKMEKLIRSSNEHPTPAPELTGVNM